MLGTSRQILPRDRTNTGRRRGQTVYYRNYKGVGREKHSIESAETLSSTIRGAGRGGEVGEGMKGERGVTGSVDKGGMGGGRAWFGSSTNYSWEERKTERMDLKSRRDNKLWT